MYMHGCLECMLCVVCVLYIPLSQLPLSFDWLVCGHITNMHYHIVLLSKSCHVYSQHVATSILTVKTKC